MLHIRTMITLLLLCLFVFVKNIATWSDEPHMLISYIAYHNLSDTQKAIIDKIYQHSHDSHFNNPITAAAWADDIKKHDHGRAPYSFSFRRNELLDIFNDWHYVKMAYNPTQANISSVYMHAHKGKHTGAGITKHIYRTLIGVHKKPKHGTYYSYNFYLNFFIHIFSDIHQPMHTINFYNTHFINGDKGGNHITVSYRGITGNIHHLCDNIFKTRKNKWPYINMEVLKRDAITLMNKYPITSFREMLRIPRDKISYIDTILKESHELAIEHVYNKLPMQHLNKDIIFHVSKYFIKKLKSVLNERMVLAGYRLSEYLKDILDSVPDDL
ncbi:p1/s1 nuclease, putative [Plasmodium ovale]|uniref:p1/s1 nuclease, putative n=2 Tax=Plasmodium ovale TaxID=36330 RepID=A0A1C3KXI7_PLAOA|nr:p1/s1 nuclease, putative [Plasmodium ovale]